MFDKEVFKINKTEYYIHKDFDLLKDKHIQILKYLINNLDIEFAIIENHLFSYSIIVRYKSKILKEIISCKINQSIINNFDNLYNIDSIIIIINELLRDIDFKITQKKRFGIIPITELPHKFYHKALTIHV